MRVNPLDLIEILGEYVTVTFGIYYRNGYLDIPMLLQEDCMEEVSFFTVVCGSGLYPDNKLDISGRVYLESLYGAMYLKK